METVVRQHFPLGRARKRNSQARPGREQPHSSARFCDTHVGEKTAAERRQNGEFGSFQLVSVKSSKWLCASAFVQIVGQAPPDGNAGENVSGRCQPTALRSIMACHPLWQA